MRYFHPYVFLFFVVINVTTTLFCAHEEISTKSDAFDVYHSWLHGLPRLYNFATIKEDAESGCKELSQVCPESQPPMSFALYCNEHNIDDSCVSVHEFWRYVYNVLEPWAIEARESRLKLPVPRVLQEVFKNILPPEVVKLVKDYSRQDLETTPLEHGINDTHRIFIKVYSPDPYNCFKVKDLSLSLEVQSTAKFSEILSQARDKAGKSFGRAQLCLERNSWLIKSMQDLVYRRLLDKKGSLELK